MRSRTSDAKLIGLFLDMLAAEQGAGPNTLDAYRRDLTDFSEFLARQGLGFAGAQTQSLRDYLADLDARGFKSSSVARRLAESVVDRRRRSHADACQGADAGERSIGFAAAARGAALLPARSALRHR